MAISSLTDCFGRQSFANGYELVDGEKMHAERGEHFQIVNPWFKKYLDTGHFVELRVDSPRFSAHPGAPDNCTCPHCDEEATKPILGHAEPASLFPLPKQDIPSRGWGEDFWVRIETSEQGYSCGIVDNYLYETRLHEIKQNDRIYFHADHVLTLHGIHNREIVESMSAEDVDSFRSWLEARLER
jgi:hypothetical protein